MSPLTVARRVLVAVLLICLGAAATVPVAGPSSWSAAPLPLSFSLDPLSATLLVYVVALGVIATTYSATNLRGQPRQARFAVLMLVAIAALAVMVTGADLLTTALGWTLSGLAMAALVGHRSTPQAGRASRYVATRLLVGDLFLWTAVATAGWGLSTLDRRGLGDALAGPTATTLVIGLLILAACVVRSALVPFQRWLPETAEAPSPVSALLHAGLVNGAGMLALLYWPLLSGSVWVSLGFVIIGVTSAAIGMLALLVRPDVKGKLAGSTTAQMGFVAMQVGLGLHGAVLLHVLGHGAWKAWLFLRAGGAVQRGRRGRSQESLSARALLPGAPAAAAVGLAVWTLAQAVDLAPVAVLFVGTMAAVLAMVIAAEALRLEDTTRLQRLLAALAGTALAGLYATWALGLEQATTSWFPESGRSDLQGMALATIALLTLLALMLLVSRFGTRSTSALATLASASTLPPGTRLRGRDPLASRAAGLASAGSHGIHSTSGDVGGLPRDHIGVAVELAAMAVGPAWPLRATVAASPLAGLESLAVGDAAEVVARLRGRDPRPTLSSFLALHRSGEITAQALEQALHENAALRELLTDTAGVEELTRRTQHLVDSVTPAASPHLWMAQRDRGRYGPRWRLTRSPDELLVLHASAWTARAWSDSTTVHDATPTGPWTLWRAAAAHRAYDRAMGIRGAARFAAGLPHEPVEAIEVLWSHLHAATGIDFYRYVAELLAAAPGWTAHAKWRVRERASSEQLAQLVAVHMALDLLIRDAARPSTRPLGAPPTPPVGDPTVRQAEQLLLEAWQRALDLTVRAPLVAGMITEQDASGATSHPVSQSVWCIDVRSERLRRHLERVGDHQTHGFAGFFGAAVRHVDADGNAYDQCPVLIKPTMVARSLRTNLRLTEVLHRLATRVGRQPLTTFTFAEISGVAALAASSAALASPHRWRDLLASWSERTLDGNEMTAAGQELSLSVDDGETWAAQLPVTVGADLVEQLLRSTAVTDAWSPLIVLVGHHATTENNAFATAYDCGACGGNSGVVNARIVADAVNDPAVRQELARRGFDIPDHAVAVAAVHDTATDLVAVQPSVASSAALAASPQARLALAHFVDDVSHAGSSVGEERGRLLPHDERPRRPRALIDRASDWAEPMPEWGLAGNCAIVVGPRRFTERMDLRGTVFLHSYEESLDPEHALLTAILTGPVVVSQWISAQYYFSCAAPELYGSGDKTTHNVVGDVGVISGAHGDLRNGLPWQSLFTHEPGSGHVSGQQLHLPVRHLAVIVADRDAVLRLVQAHPTLYQLVGHGWMSLVVVDPANRGAWELTRSLTWAPCTHQDLVAGLAGDASSVSPATPTTTG